MVFEFFKYVLYNFTFSFEVIFFQLIIFYLLILIYISVNIYYSLLYITFLFFIFGIFLSFWQLDIYTGFLWLLELTIIFVFLLILFYLNFKGYSQHNTELKTNILNLYKVMFILIYIVINFMFISNSELIILNEFSEYIFYENYYEALTNHNMNDFSVFLLSYYDFNSLEFIIIGIILLVGSMICVNLYKINKNSTAESFSQFSSFFKLFKDSLTYNFLRKQSLVNQNLTLPSTRIVNKNK